MILPGTRSYARCVRGTRCSEARRRGARQPRHPFHPQGGVRMSFDDMDVPTVSPMIGEGADAHRLVRWAGTPSRPGRTTTSRDARCRAGRELGYGQPRDIRKLISRLAKEGKLPDVHVRATVARTQMPTGGVLRDEGQRVLADRGGGSLPRGEERDRGGRCAASGGHPRVHAGSSRPASAAGERPGDVHGASEIRQIQTLQQAAIARQDAAMVQQAEAVTALVAAVAGIGDLVRTIFDDHDHAACVGGRLRARDGSRRTSARTACSCRMARRPIRSRGAKAARRSSAVTSAFGRRPCLARPADRGLRPGAVKLHEMIRKAERIAQRRQLDLPPAA